MAQRTQVYLDPDDHRRLRRLAAERSTSMTELVREAVARYLAEEGGDDEVLDRLALTGSTAGLPAGPEGLVARLRRRRDAEAPAAAPAPSVLDHELADAGEGSEAR